MKKELITIIIEMIISVTITLVSIPIWNKLNNTEFFNEKYKEEKIIQMNVDNYLSDSIVKLDNKDTIDSSTIYIHNVNSYINGVEFNLKITKEIKPYLNFIIVNIGDNYYNIVDLIKYENEDYYYIQLDKSKYKEYETKCYKVKLLLSNDYKNKYDIKFGYEFTSNTL